MEKTSNHPNRFEWWVNSKARVSGHRSKMGPFKTVREASEWLEANRNLYEWKNVSITSRCRR